jgi:hypothetical protein
MNKDCHKILSYIIYFIRKANKRPEYWEQNHLDLQHWLHPDRTSSLSQPLTEE